MPATDTRPAIRPALRQTAMLRAGRGWSRPSRRLLVLTAFAILGVALLSALGVWQVERRAWKLALIDRVDQRVHAVPVAAPGLADWPAVTRDRDEYRRVTADGYFLNDRETLVRATTGLGAGYWVITPFRTDTGFTMLVNRGFVPPDRRDPDSRRSGAVAGETRVTGLLRISEPGGGFLRANDPARDRWYSRDVAAIANAHGLSDVAPYFVDAGETPAVAGGWPRGGLTVIAFPNNHLLYAVTWFGLALMLSCAIVYAWREEGQHDGRRSPTD